MDIALIGLGLLGSAMARRLVAAGYRVRGHDIRPEATAQARALGVAAYGDVGEAAAGTRIVLVSLMTSEDRRTLLWGPQQLARQLEAGTILLDTTTGRPEDLRDDAARLATQGVRLVDVCVSGSSQTVDAGHALALVGDSEPGAAVYSPVLRAFTKAQFYFGGPGKGNEAKLIVNTVMGLNRLVLAEALGLARKAGFDLALMLEVLRQGDTYSVCMDTKGPKMVSGIYTPAAARLEQHAKDVQLILDYAASLGASVPVSRVHADQLAKALSAGGEGLDNAAIFKAYG